MLLESSTMKMKLTLVVFCFYFAYANACVAIPNTAYHLLNPRFKRFAESIDVTAEEDTEWTFGDCMPNKSSCQRLQYGIYNLTEALGTKLENIKFGSVDHTILSSIIYPNGTMDCKQLCNCLSCSSGQCDDNVDQATCSETRGSHANVYLCKCSKSDVYPTFREIMMDMLKTNQACRTCPK
jgi:hypothetical protein